MLVRFDKIKEISDGVTQFYTIRLGNNELTEFELFDAKEFPDHAEELEITYNVINEMRNREARLRFFKDESGAHALPRVSQEIMDANKGDYGIRLYCIYVRPELVILSNGDIKTSQHPEDCPQVKDHFRRIRRIAALLDKAITNKEIYLDETDPYNDFQLEI